MVTKIIILLMCESHLCRSVGAVADIAMIFLPGGVRSGREAVQRILNRQQTKRPMPIIKDKPWYQSKTIWGALFTILFAVLLNFGVDITANPELTDSILQVAMILSGAFGAYGLRDAIGKWREDLKSN